MFKRNCIAFMYSALAVFAGQVEASDLVIAVVGDAQEPLGALETGPDKAGSMSPRLVTPSVYIDGYCKRAVVPLAPLPGGASRLGLGEALSRFGVRAEYAFAEEVGQCGSSQYYFLPGLLAGTQEMVVSHFLGSLHRWRSSGLSSSDRFTVTSDAEQALGCAKSASRLQVHSFWEYFANNVPDSDARTFKVIFDQCSDPETGRPLGAIVRHHVATRALEMRLTFDESMVD